MTNLVVKPHKPWRVRLFTASLATVLVLSGWGLFEYGRYRGGFDRIAAAKERKSLLSVSTKQMDTIKDLREQQAILQRTRDVEREAYGQLQHTVGSLQDEILELKEELAFYRSIIAPSDGSEGLHVQDFEVTPALGDRNWHYKLVLTQVRKNDTVASGTVSITVEGLQNGKPNKLPLDKLVADGKGEWSFKFKYFQDLEGDFSIPEGFQPAKVVVAVDPRGSRRPRLEESYDWPAEEN